MDKKMVAEELVRVAKDLSADLRMPVNPTSDVVKGLWDVEAKLLQLRKLVERNSEAMEPRDLRVISEYLRSKVLRQHDFFCRCHQR